MNAMLVKLSAGPLPGSATRRMTSSRAIARTSDVSAAAGRANALTIETKNWRGPVSSSHYDDVRPGLSRVLYGIYSIRGPMKFLSCRVALD